MADDTNPYEQVFKGDYDTMRIRDARRYATCSLNIRKMPKTVRDAFQVHCVKQKITMKDAIIKLMRWACTQQVMINALPGNTGKT
jgi:hypothetical protein